MITLPSTEASEHVATLFCLNREQLEALDEASEPDHFIAMAKMMRHRGAFPGNAVEQHAWTSAARQIWRCNKSSNSLFLTSLNEVALATQGRILHRPELENYIAMDDIDKFREKLNRLLSELTYI